PASPAWSRDSVGRSRRAGASVDALSFSTDTAPPVIYTLSLHDALPIYESRPLTRTSHSPSVSGGSSQPPSTNGKHPSQRSSATGDRKSTRLNSSHVKISYAVFCSKKKKTRTWTARARPRCCGTISPALV